MELHGGINVLCALGQSADPDAAVLKLKGPVQPRLCERPLKAQVHFGRTGRLEVSEQAIWIHFHQAIQDGLQFAQVRGALRLHSQWPSCTERD